MFAYSQKLVRWLAVGVFTLLSACSVPAETVLPSITPQSPTKTPTPAPSPTNTLHPTITPLPTRVTPTVYPPLVAGEDWLPYRNEDLGLGLFYPPNWTIQSDTEIRGKDGFIWLKRIASEGKQPDAFCQIKVNAGIPQPYGSYPEIREVYSQGLYGCLVVPSADSSQAGIVSAFLWQAVDTGNIIKAEGTEGFIEPILISGYALQPQKEISIDGYVPAECRFDQDPPLIFEEGGLKFEQYRLTSDDCYQTMEVETFASLLPLEAREKAAALRELTPSYIQQVNQMLTPFDYEFKEGAFYYQGGKAVPFNVVWIGKPEIDAEQTQFFLPVQDDQYGLPQIITLNGVEDIPYQFISSLGYVPSRVFIGDDLISVTFDEDQPSQVGDLRHLQVRLNDEVIYTFATMPFGPPGGPVRGLWREGDSWLLDLADVFIKDGEILNEVYHYQAMFTYRQINDKPFYFYQQDGEIFISYDEQILSPIFQEVIHTPSCCSGAMVNMTLGHDGLAFYGSQDGFWVYTIITLADE